jgi:hypothetical protein
MPSGMVPPVPDQAMHESPVIAWFPLGKMSTELKGSLTIFLQFVIFL